MILLIKLLNLKVLYMLLKQYILYEFNLFYTVNDICWIIIL
jgi:hypothetical protein